MKPNLKLNAQLKCNLLLQKSLKGGQLPLQEGTRSGQEPFAVLYSSTLPLCGTEPFGEVLCPKPELVRQVLGCCVLCHVPCFGQIKCLSEQKMILIVYLGA